MTAAETVAIRALVARRAQALDAAAETARAVLAQALHVPEAAEAHRVLTAALNEPASQSIRCIVAGGMEAWP